MTAARIWVALIWSTILFSWSNPAQAQCECLCVNGKMQPICRGSVVPPVCPATSCGSSSHSDPAPKPSPSPFPLSTAAQRAAYCSAVLSDVIASTPEYAEVEGPDGRVFKFPSNTPRDIIESKMAKEYGYKANLTGLSTPSPMAPTATRDNLGQRHERYTRYIRDELLRIVASGGDGVPLLLQAKLIRANGQRDAGASRTAFATAEFARCSTQWSPSPSQDRCSC